MLLLFHNFFFFQSYKRRLHVNIKNIYKNVSNYQHIVVYKKTPYNIFDFKIEKNWGKNAKTFQCNYDKAKNLMEN